MMSQIRHGIEPGRARAIDKGWLAAGVRRVRDPVGPPGGPWPLTDLSDTPMFTRILPPPANIMFLLDDSGSMNFEVLVTGQFDGSFPNPDKARRIW